MHSVRVWLSDGKGAEPDTEGIPVCRPSPQKDTTLDEDYSGQSIEDIAEDIMRVPIPQYSERKRRMYEAAREYYDALEKSTSRESLQKLKEKLDVLSSEYSDNPAYAALMKQKYLEKKVEIDAE